MKKIIITFVFVAFYGLSFSQNYSFNSSFDISSKNHFKFSRNLWVLDTVLGFSGLGSTGWDYDQLEVVSARNDKGLPLILELSEKIEGTATWVNAYYGVYSYFDNDTVNQYNVKEWNTQTNNWNNDVSYFLQKQQDGKVLVEFLRYWDNENQYFYQGNKEIFTYDNNGVLSSKEDQDWDGSNWTQYLNTIFFYDENGNDTLELQQMFLGGSQWRDNWKIFRTYDDQNMLIQELQTGYDSYYDEWYLYSKTNYSYYPNGKLEQQFTQRYDENNQEWYDFSQSDYYYTDDDLIWYIEEYDLEDLSNSLKYEYTYNDNLDETSFFLYSYNSKSWTLFYKVFDEYDANFNQISYYSQMLDGSWQNFLKEEYLWNYYQTNIQDDFNEEVSVYPNPVLNVLNINVEDLVCVQIFNSLGQKLISSTNNVIDVSGLPKGNYFVVIYRENEKNIKKIVKR